MVRAKFRELESLLEDTDSENEMTTVLEESFSLSYLYGSDCDAEDYIFCQGTRDVKVMELNAFLSAPRMKGDIDVMEMMATLQPIDEVFLNLEESLGDEFSNSNEKDVNLMDGGSDFLMTEDQYDHLKSAVNELRTKIVESDF